MPADLVLTKRQREILEALAGGALITVNTLNIASLNGATLSPVTRAFLTQHRLIGHDRLPRKIITLVIDT